MNQLSPQDALFLSMETPELPAHIGGLTFLEPTEGFDFGYASFVEFIRERIGPVDRFSWKLQEVPFGLDRPYWVKSEDFDPADHCHAIRIPEPYSPEALGKLAGRIFERPMDRARPLWDLTLIEGLPGGRFAMLWRMHHCLMDGTSGAHLSELLFDLTPDANQSAASMAGTHTGAQPSPNRSQPVAAHLTAARALLHAAELPSKHSRFVTRAIKSWRQSGENTPAVPSPSERPPQANLAPSVPWNGVVGAHRNVAWTTLSLSEVKRAKETLGVTVNDVVLALTGGAVRSYLQERKQLPEASLIASVPCSMRAKDDHSMGNKIRETPIHWGTDIEDPVERVQAIHEYAKRAKASVREGNTIDLTEVLGEALLPVACHLFMRGAAVAGPKMPLPANAVVSNVPMAPVPLYLASARIEQVVPMSLLAPTQGLNITLVSYCDELHFGLVHDPELLENGWDIAGRIEKQLGELQQSIDRNMAADPNVSNASNPSDPDSKDPAASRADSATS